MGLELIRNSLKVTFITGVLLFPLLWSLGSLNSATGFLAGTMWGILNLALIQQVIVEIVSLKKTNKLKVGLLLLIKMPLLYLIGYEVLKTKYFSILSLLLGFNLIFMVIFFSILIFCNKRLFYEKS